MTTTLAIGGNVVVDEVTTQTITGNKTFTGSNLFELDIAGTKSLKIHTLTNTTLNAMTGASGSISTVSGNFTYGMKFTITTGIIVTAVKFQSAFWGSVLTSRQVGIWNSTGTLLFSTSITQGTLISGYYVQLVNFYLPIGAYTIGFFIAANDNYYGSSAGMIFDSHLTSIDGVFSSGSFQRPINITLSNYIPVGNFEFVVGDYNMTVQSDVLTIFKPNISAILNSGATLSVPPTTGTIASIVSATTANHLVSFDSSVGSIKDSGIATTDIALIQGTSDSALSGKLKRFYVSGQTVGAVITNLLTAQTIPIDSSITVEIIINGYDSFGVSVNNSLNRHYETRVKNVGGTYTVGASLQNLVSSDAGLLLTATVNVTAGVGDFSVSVTGVVGETIDWSGTVLYYY